MMEYGNMHGWGMGIILIAALLFIALLIWLILLVSLHFTPKNKANKLLKRDTENKDLSN